VRVQLSSLEADLGILRTDVQNKAYGEIEALSASVGQLYTQITAVQEELRKPPDLPLQLMQQFHDRLLMQEQKQKEQDDHIRRILEKLTLEPNPLGPVKNEEEEEENTTILLKQLKEGRKQLDHKDMQSKERMRDLSPGRQAPGNDAIGSKGSGAAFARVRLVSDNQPETEDGGDETPGRDAQNQIMNSEQEAFEAPTRKQSDFTNGTSSSNSPKRAGRKRPEVLRESKSTVQREEQFQNGAYKAKRQQHRGGLHLKHEHTAPPATFERKATAETKLAKQTLQGPLEQPSTVDWNASVWEASLFIGARGIQFGASCQMFILLLANIIAQFCFCAIVYLNFTEPNYDDTTLQRAEIFRYSIGHDVKFQDTLSHQSLMSMICDGHQGLNMGTLQSGMLGDIWAYRGDDDLQKFFGGLMMCVLALGCWTLVYLAEIERALQLSWALTRLPSMRVTSLLVDAEDRIEVEGWSSERFVFAAILLLVRFVISSFLLICGSMWLTYTINVENLLLNAVALGFVLDLDEMLFTLAPAQVKSLMGRLQPLPAQSWPSVKGTDLVTITQTIFVPALVIIMYFSILAPQWQTMDDIESSFCDGNRDFVYSTDAIGFTYIDQATILSPNEPRSLSTKAAVQEAVLSPQLAWMNDSLVSAHLTAGLVATEFVDALNAASVLAGMEVAQLVDLFNPLCIDNVWDIVPQIKLNFGTLTANASWPTYTCDNQLHHWHGNTWQGIYVRFNCPRSAGCAHPLSPVYSTASSHGCPKACEAERQSIVSAFPCQDQDVVSSNYWASWVSFIAESARKSEGTKPGTTPIGFGNRLEAELLQGCSALQYIENYSLPIFTRLGLCAGTEYDVHPLANACPQACGCEFGASFSLLAHCPTACLAETIA